MKTIVETLPKKYIITIYEALSTEQHNSTSYICYVVSSEDTNAKNGTGVAVLHRKGSYFGFIYHTYLIDRTRSFSSIMDKYTFQTDSEMRSISKAIKAGKKVYLLENYEEFLDLCKQYTQY